MAGQRANEGCEAGDGPPRRRGGPVPGRVPGREPLVGNVTPLPASPSRFLPPHPHTPAPGSARGGGGNGGVRVEGAGPRRPASIPVPQELCLVQEGLGGPWRWSCGEPPSAPSPPGLREGLEVTGGDCQGFGWRPA